VKTFKEFIIEVETLRAINPINKKQTISLDDPEVQKNIRSAIIQPKLTKPKKSTDSIGKFVRRMTQNTLLSPQ
jgi:hypothetical protein